MDGTPLEMAQACAQSAIDARREIESGSHGDSRRSALLAVSEMTLDQMARWALLSIAESLATDIELRTAL